MPEIIPINQRLDRMFVEMARDDGGYHKLPIIRAALMQPGSMTNWRETLLTQMCVPVAGLGPIVDAICDTLTLECPARVAEI